MQDDPVSCQLRVKPAPLSPNAAVLPHPTSPQQQFEVPLVNLVQPAPDSEIRAPTTFTVPSISQQQRPIEVASQVSNVRRPDRQELEVSLVHKALHILVSSSRPLSSPWQLYFWHSLSSHQPSSPTRISYGQRTKTLAIVRVLPSSQ